MGQLQNNLAEQDSFVPVIDIASYFSGTPEGKHRVAQQIGRACREVGFYVIVGHGVDPKLVEQVEIVSREFFDLPLEEKMRLHVGKEPGAVGYAAIFVSSSAPLKALATLEVCTSFRSVRPAGLRPRAASDR